MPEESMKKVEELKKGDVFKAPNSGTLLEVTRGPQFDIPKEGFEIMARPEGSQTISRQYFFNREQKVEIVPVTEKKK